MATPLAEMQKDLSAGLLDAFSKAVQANQADPSVSVIDAFAEGAKNTAQELAPSFINDVLDAFPDDVAGPIFDGIKGMVQDALNKKVDEAQDAALGVSDLVDKFGSGDVDGFPSDQALDMCLLGGLVLTLVQDEFADYPNMVPVHPVQKRRSIGDHVWIEVERFTISGIASAGNINSSAHKDIYQTLLDLRNAGDPLTFIWDHPPGTLENVVIEDVRITRQNPLRHSYNYAVDLVWVEVVEEEEGVDPLDPTTGIGAGGVGSDMGDTSPQVYGPPTPNQVGGQPDSSGTGPQQGDGGLGGFLSKMIDTVKGVGEGVGDFLNSDIGRFAKNALKEVAKRSPIGGDMLAAVLDGDFSAGSIAKGILSFVPGGGILGDAASAVAASIAEGDLSVGNLAGNFLQEALEGSPVGDVLDVIGGVPGTDKIVSEVLNGNFDAASLGSAFLGEFVGQVGAESPLLGDIAGVVSGWLKNASK